MINLQEELDIYIKKAAALDAEIAKTQEKLRELQNQRETLLLKSFLESIVYVERIPGE